MITPNPKNSLRLTHKFSTSKLLFLLFLSLSFNGFGQQKSFPTATGAGANATGGRGGTVYHVTNLNNSGSGSLRDAVSQSNRTIVFDVSGIIQLTSDLVILKNNLTLAGQSAPSGGITITGKPVYFQDTNNIILRYLRFRPDYDTSGIVDALNAYNCTNFIADHCSVSWGGDEAFSLRGNSKDVTVQNCVFGESATGMLAGDSGSASSDNFSIIGNLWYNISHRFPNVNAIRTDVINNVVHNWYSHLMTVSSRDYAKLNEINNFYQSGTTTGEPDGYDSSVNWLDIGTASQRSNIRIYTDGNVYPSFLTEAQNDWKLYVHRFAITSGAYAGTEQFDAGSTNFRKSAPFPLLGVSPNIMSADEVKDYVPNNAGANKYLNSNGSFGVFRDNIDATYVLNVTNGTSEYYEYPPTNIVNKQSYVNFHNSVTAEPINTRSNNYDTDNDGMADSWELNTFSTLSRNGTQDYDGDGYTDLEEFLNGVDSDPSVIIDNEVTITSNDSNNTICEGKSVILTASQADSYQWSTGATTSSITVSPSSSELYSVTAQFINGETAQDEITIYVEDSPVVNAGQNQTIDLGQSVTLTANGANAYTWNTGQTTTSITVSPNITTTYTVTGTTNGCEDSDSVTVFVQTGNETVNADIAGGNYSICSGVTTTLVASGGSSYLWNTGQTTSSITITPTVTSTYTVTAFSASGNSQDQDSVTITVKNRPNVDAGLDQTIYNNESTTLTASGAETYLWNTGQTTASIVVSPNDNTTYSVTGYQYGCSNSDNVTVFVQEEDDVNANISTENDTLCEGTSTILTASGGVNYLWSTGETTSSITVTPDTTTSYSVTVYSSSGSNQDQDSIVITVYDEVDANAGNDVEICQGSSTTLTASGGMTYLWSTGATSQSITVSPNQQTTYSVEVSNQACSDIDEVTVKIKPNPDINAGNDVTIFQGQSTTLSVTGGTSYLWNTGQASSSINVSPSVTTSYTVTGYLNGCEGTDQVTVYVQTENITANAGSDVTICQGETTTLTATGGSSYEWSTGDTTQSIQVSPSSTTIYTVTAFSSTGTSEDSDSVIVTVNPTPEVNAGNNITIVQGESTILTASGANSYLWSSGQTSSSITVNPNSTTTYSVTGSSNGCEDIDQVTVFVDNGTGNETVNADIAGGNFSICAGTTTVLVATGGSSYLWSTGETTSIIAISPSETTTYTVTAYSASGNSQDQDSLMVSVYGNVDAGDDVEICLGSTVTLTSSVGESYLWSTGETTQSINVSPNETTTYTVELVEKFCTSTDDVTVTIGDTLNVNAGNDVTIDQGQFITLTASGADSYVWSTGQTNSSITVNPNMTTTYSVTGYSGGCQATDEIIVSVESETVTANAGPDVSVCYGEASILTATGGTSYLWNTGETSASITVAPEEATTYYVTAFGTSQSNSDEDSVTVTVNPLPDVNAGENVTIIQGDTTSLTATGAESYVWNTGETTATISVSPNVTTTYTVTGFLNGCMATDQVTVFVDNDDTNETVDADIGGGNFSICAGTTTTLVASGGSSYLWSTGETTTSIMISPTETTTYTVIAYSESGNTQDQDSVTVTVYGNIFAGDDVEICLGSSTILTASEASTYLWSTGETTQSITVSPNETTTYSVGVFERFCSSTDEVTVTVNESLSINAGNDVSIVEGNSTTLSASGAESYLWSTGETTSSITVSPNDTTTYSVTGFSNSCEGSDEVIVTVEDDEELEIVEADIAGGNFTICSGATTTLVASGGASYLWSTGETTPVIMVSPDITTTYVVTAFSESGNSQDQDSIIVGVNNVQVDAGDDITILEGDSTTLTAFGASSYLWSTGETTQSITVNPSSSVVYTVTGFKKGCQDTDEVAVTVDSRGIRHELFELIVFQDPRSRVLKVKLIGMTDATPKEISLLDINGRTLYNDTMNPTEVEKSIDVSRHKYGIYALRLIYDDQKIVKKIVLK